MKTFQDLLVYLRTSSTTCTSLQSFSSLLKHTKLKDLKAYLYINRLRGNLKVINGSINYCK